MRKRTLYLLLALILVLQGCLVWECLRAFNTIPLLRSSLQNILHPITIQDPDKELVTIRDIFGRYGYMDVHGRIVIAPWYSDADDFSEGLAAVKIGDKWGYIDRTGKIVIKPQFSGAYEFDNGQAKIVKYDPRYDPNSSDKTYQKQGIIDKQGKIIVPPEFAYLGDLSDGMIQVSNGDYGEGETGFLNSNYQLVIPLTYTFAADFKNGYSFVDSSGSWGVIDKSGRMVTQYQFSDLKDIGDGLYMAQDFHSNLWGEINSKGDYINSVRFQGVGDLSEGLFAVRDAKSDLWGYLSGSGDVVIPFQYADAKSFQNGLAAVEDVKTHHMGFIDAQGKLVISYQFLADTYWTNPRAVNDLFLVSTKNNVRKLIDRTGKTIIDNIIESSILDTNTGKLVYIGDAECGYSEQGLYWAAVKPGWLTFFDSNGNIKFVTKGDYAGQFSEGLCEVSSGKTITTGSCGYIDVTGRRVIDVKCSYAGDFKNGLAEIYFGDGVNNTGYINTSGNYLWMPGTAGGKALIFAFLLMVASLTIAFAVIRIHMYAPNAMIDYDTINPDTDLHPIVDKRNRFGYADASGDVAISSRFLEAHPFHDGIAKVNVGGAWRYINKYGKFAFRNIYLFQDDFQNGCAVVCMNWGDLLWGVIDVHGNTVAPFQYKSIQNELDGMHVAQNKDGMWGYLDENYREAIPFVYSEAQDFGEDLAGVKEEATGLWGYVDKRGEVIIAHQFKDTLGFFEGLASVQSPETGLWGFADNQGKLVIPYSFTDAGRFEGDLAIVAESGKRYEINRDGQKVREIEWEDFQNDFIVEPKIIGAPQLGAVATQVNFAVPLKYQIIRDCFDGLRAAQNSHGKWGYLDDNYRKAIPFVYSDVLDFSEGFAGVKEETTELWGYIDREGALRIPHQFSGAQGFSEGLASVFDPETELWGYVDKQGNRVIPYWFSECGRFEGGLALVMKSSGKRYVVNTEGRIIREITGRYGYKGEGLHWADDENGKIVYFRSNGEEVDKA